MTGPRAAAGWPRALLLVLLCAAGSWTGAFAQTTPPTVTLVLSPSSISESGGESTVTATLSGTTSEAVTVTVGAAAGTGAVAADFTLSSANTLTIAAGSTTSTGTVTVTANGNTVQTPDKEVTVTGTVTGGNGAAAPSAVTLTLDDDDTPALVLTLLRDSFPIPNPLIAGENFTFPYYLRLNSRPAANVTVNVTHAGSPDISFSRTSFTFTPANWNIVQSDNINYARDADFTRDVAVITYTATGGGYGGVSAEIQAVVREDGSPLAGLVVWPQTTAQSRLLVAEAGGQATFLVNLNTSSSEAVTVSVSSLDPTEGTVDPSELVFQPSVPNPSQRVTVTGADDADNDGDVDWVVRLDPSSGDAAYNALPNVDVLVTTINDDGPPTVTLSLSPSSISENGGESTVTASLLRTWNTAMTVTVGAAAGTGAVAQDFTLSAANTLTIAAGDTASTGAVTVTANDNEVGFPNKSVTISGTVTAGGNGVAAPSAVTLTLVDDDPLAVVLIFDDGRDALPQPLITQENSFLRYKVRLASLPTADVTVTVTHLGSPDISVDGTSFTFTPANWNIGQLDRLRLAGDADSTRDVAVLSYAAAGGNYEGVRTDFRVITRESNFNIPAGLLVSPQTTAQSRLRVTEAGGQATFLVNLLRGSSSAVTVSVSSLDPTEGTVDPSVLVFQPSAVPATQRVTVTGADDGDDDGSVDWAVRLGPSSGDAAYNGLADVDVLVTTIDDDGTSGVSLSLSPSSVSENGGVSSVTATLSEATSEALTVTVGAAAGAGAAAEDFTLSTANTLTIAAGATTSTGDVTVTANDNAVDSPDKQVTVSGTVTGGNGAAAPSAVTLTLTDDEALPTVTLSLSPASISESGGESSVTATLSGASSEAVTVTVGAAAGAGAVATDFTLSTANTLTIAAGDTASTGDVTVTAVGNAVQTPDKSVTVSGMVTGGNGVAAPSDVTLTLADDDSPPTLTLVLSPSSISESGGESTVTAALSRAWSAAVTVTVGAAAGTGAVAQDFTLSGANTLTIAAGNTASTGAVTVTANGNFLDSPNKSVTVSGTVTTGDAGVANPSDVTLTLVDDDPPPAVVLAFPNGNIIPHPLIVSEAIRSRYTVRLAARPTENVTVTVTRTGSPDIRAERTSFTFTPANWNIAQWTRINVAGDADSRRDVAILSYTAAGGNYEGVSANINVVTRESGVDSAGLLVSPQTTAQSRLRVTEAGGQATFLVNLNTNSSAAVTVSVSSLDPSEGTVDPSELVFQPSGTNPSQRVTVTGADDAGDDGSVDWAVRLDPSSGDAAYNGLANVDVLVTTLDDDGVSGVALSLSPSSVSESGGVSSVTATLSEATSEALTVTVGAAAGTGAAAEDFTLSEANTLTIAAGSTTSTGAVTVTANGNVVDSPNKEVTVTGTVTGGNGAAAPSAVTLTLEDDEDLPTVTLALSPSSISENGGESSVTATLSGASSEAVTVTVGAAAGTGAVVADFTLSTANTLTIAAGDTTSTGDVTVTANDNTAPTPDKSVTVSGTVTGGNGVVAPSDVTLTLEDDEAPPPVTLVLSPSSISESGGESTVTATLRRTWSAAVTVTVGAAAGTGAAAEDFTLSAANTLTIAVGDTTSTGTVTVRANGNDVDSPDKSVTVSGTVTAGGSGVTNPSAVTLTLADDEALPTVTLALSSSSISESGGESTVTATLSGASSEAVTVTVGAAAGTGAVPADFTLSTANTLTIAAGDTASTGDVTVTAVGNTAQTPDKSVTVSGTVTGGNGVAAPSAQTLTLADDDTPPAVTLSLSPSSIWESGGESTVTAELSRTLGTAVTVTVGAAAGTGAVPVDFTLSQANTLTIAAGDTASTGTVTVTANGNDVDAPDKSVTVSGTVTTGVSGVTNPAQVTLTLRDDDPAALVLDRNGPIPNPWVVEAGRPYPYTLRLLNRPAENVTVTVTVTGPTIDGSENRAFTAPDTDSVTRENHVFIRSDRWSFTFTPDNWNVNQAAGIGIREDDDSTSDFATITYTASEGSYEGVSAGVNLLIRENNDDPAAGLVVSPQTTAQSRLRVTEAGGEATFLVHLNTISSEAVTVSVSSLDPSEGTVSASELVFQPSRVNPSQTVTVTGVNDEDQDGSVEWAVRLDPSSGDAAYNGLANVDVLVRTVDDDGAAGLVVSPATSSTSRLRTGEDGAQATFTVALAAEPTGNVVLDVASSDTDQGTVDTDPDTNGVQSALTFTTSTWDTAQTVTLTGVDDSPGAADGSQEYTVTLEVNQAGTADARYDALSAVTVYAVNADDDATPDVNEDGSVNDQDALVMFYTYTAPILEDTDFGPALRRIVLRPYIGNRSDDAAGYLALLTAAKDWANATDGDLNNDGSVNDQDALVMFYTYTAPILEDTDFGPDLRRIVLRPYIGNRPDDAAGYLALLDAAKALATAYGSGSAP